MVWTICFFFFFQAEDGIRDTSVTGVQTCALPIYPGACGRLVSLGAVDGDSGGRGGTPWSGRGDRRDRGRALGTYAQIGRASCRERVEISVGGGGVKKN